MPYVLHNRLGSGGFAVQAALTAAGIPFELALLDSAPGTPLPESFAAVNPWRQVPVLVTPEGEVLTETAAILIYLVGRHPERDFGVRVDTPEYGQFLRWTVFLSVNVYEGILRRGYPERYTTDPAGAAAVRAAAEARTHRALGVLEGVLADRDFLLGDRRSPADIFLAMLYAWHGRRDDLPRCTALTRAVARDEVIGPVWRQNFDHRLAVKWDR